jgi:DNA replication protein DnaC
VTTTNTENDIRIEVGEHLTYYRRADNCDKHGPFENVGCIPGLHDPERKPSKWIGCPKCSEERDAERKRWQREEEMRKRLDARIARCGIPGRYREATLASYVATKAGQRHALEVAMGYAADFKARERGQSLLLLGNIGTGKTHLAIGIAREAMTQAAEAIFTTAADMIGRVKATWGQRGGESEAQVIQRFASVDLLVLDEVGSIKCVGREREILLAILGSRHNAVLPTIFTANLTVDELPSYLSDQIVSRLRESASQMVVFDWADYRPLKGKAMAGDNMTTTGLTA